MLHNKVKLLFPCLIILLAIVLNIIARFSVSFCDFYVVKIFPLIVNTYGRFFGIFPFSVGEFMLYAAVLLVIALFIGGFACLFRVKFGFNKGEDRFVNFYSCYVKFCFWVTAVISLIMTTNVLILFHCSPIYEFYGNGALANDSEREYGVYELGKLRAYVVENANLLAEELPRDENGYLVYEGDMIKQTRIEMLRLGQEFDRLAGYYPRAKALAFSNFFSRQGMMGYFFPFSMEANYNNSMYIVNFPTTICHELAHLKGFIYEDEANFIGYLACAYSDEAFFRYSAYLAVLDYLDRDFMLAAGSDVYFANPQVSDKVARDNIFLTAEAWEAVEKNALFSTDFVWDISSEILEVNLTLNGVSDGTMSYGRVVGLLLRYYDGILY